MPQCLIEVHVTFKVPVPQPRDAHIEDHRARFDPATWKKDREGIKPSASQALLTIAGSFGNRKRGYYLANQMMVSFRNVLEKADSAKEATDSQLKEARKTLAEKVSAFRTYAGIQ